MLPVFSYRSDSAVGVDVALGPLNLLTDIRADECVSAPYGAKKALAHLITARFHGAEAADGAAQDFATRFSARQIPANLPEVTIDLPERGLGLLELLCRLDFASSNSEARPLVQRNAVK